MAGRVTTDRRSDEELVGACNHGDAAEATRAFDVLYKRHKDYVVRVALRFVRDPDMALDVLQETFSYLLRKFPPTGDGLTLTLTCLRIVMSSIARESSAILSHSSKVYDNTAGLWATASSYHKNAQGGKRGRMTLLLSKASIST